MKKLVVLLVVCMFVFVACVDKSDWGKIVILSNQELIFSEPDSLYGDKQIFVLVDKDTMVINNLNQVHKLCYLKMAFPEKNIVIEYVKLNEDGKIRLDPRFMSVEK